MRATAGLGAGVFASRFRVGVALYALTAVAWTVAYPLAPAEIEPVDTVMTVLALSFSAGTALIVLRLDMPVLEFGWGLLTYSFLIRVLDEVAEGPETLEAVLPRTIQLVALVFILIGFYRTREGLRSDLAERNERLTVMNRVLRHDLRNSLDVITAALRRVRDPGSSERDTEVVTNGLDRASDLTELSEKVRGVEDVFDAETGSRRREVNTLARSVVERARTEFPNVDLTVRTSPENPRVEMVGLEMVLENLVENACEHNSTPDPAASVAVEADRRHVEVTVEDNGPGIPEHELTPVRDRTVTALDHGSGIGLWIVTWLVERAGGDVSFTRTAGQAVTVRLPRSGDGLLARISRAIRGVGGPE